MRARPRLHFTARSGWINDPHGIVWHDGQYHLFYQAIPDSTAWAPQCRWGHATSPDLLTWTEQPIALTPNPAIETGCWSGCVLADDEPIAYYTRVREPNLDHGAIAVARGSADLTTWTSGEVVVPTPSDAAVFRDPVVFADGWGWLMIVGGQRTDGAAAVWRFRSDDRVTWHADGLLCVGPTGVIWECPQFFALDDDWALVVSRCDASAPLNVVVARGDYDGAVFAPHSWHELAPGDCAYATTAFLDRDGRRCLMSWLREAPGATPDGFAGAHSAPALVEPDGAGVCLRPHPNLALDGAVLRDADIVEEYEPYRVYRV